ncbi:hypothetical protein OQA88_13695 [Cercophora sp. LCS_1]
MIFGESVWPAPAGAQDQAQTITDNISREEMTNQHSFGSHASNTKGRVVHLKKCCPCPWQHDPDDTSLDD